MAEKIISKGFYSHAGIPNFVSVQQYIVIKKGKKRHLFLRFNNPRDERISSISFSVERYDYSGNLIGSTKVDKSNLKANSRSNFVVDRPVVMEDGCVDFKVIIHSVTYGDYKYVTHGDEIQVLYEKQEKNKEFDNLPFLKRMGGNAHKAIVRTLHAPKFFLALAILILVVLSAIVGVKLHEFTTTEILFTLDKVDYTFATEDRESGPIIIIGYKSNASKIVIPDSIEGHDVIAVESYAFENSNIKSVRFEGSIEINPYAFNNCSKLETVHIDSTNDLGSYAFSNCIALQNVYIHKKIENIGTGAFQNCPSLTEIIIPNTLKTVGDKAFAYCSSLSSLNIPNSTVSIGKSVLLNCSSIASLTTPFLGHNVDTVASLNYLFASSTPSSLKNLTVTKTMDIHDEMFRDEASLEAVTFTQPILTIGNRAFEGCASLRTFNIPETTEEIGEYAFASCSSLKSISIPNGVTHLKDYTFSGCSSLESATIPSTLTQVGQYAFYNCSSLTSLNLPSRITYIGDNALYNCRSLETLVIPFLSNRRTDTPKSLEYIIGSFYDSSIKNLTVLYGKTLADSAFMNFSTLTNVILPAELETIGAHCFENCSQLTEINIPSKVTTIGSAAFSNCTALSAITIPKDVTSIANSTFSYCSSLKVAELHDDITSIGDNAFMGCSSLEAIDLPSGITQISAYAFDGCSSIDEIELSGKITAIKSYAFNGCYNLQNVTFPSSLVEIGDYAFAGCTAFSEINITESIRTLGRGAFQGCSSITSAVLPETLENIGDAVFSNCSSLTSLTAPFPTNYSYSGMFSYYFSEYSWSSSIPASLKTVIITSVGGNALPSNAFENCSYIENITLPLGLSSIGTRAFYGCSALKSLVIPDSVTSMGTDMLYGTTALESITLPYAATDTGAHSYGFIYFFGSSYSASLKTVTITKATTIPADAFNGLSSICEINLPNTLLSIGSQAFANCTMLHSITIPASVTSIASNAFNNCYRLYEVTNNSSSSFSSSFPNALRVFSAGESTANKKFTLQSYTFLKANDGNWYIVDYDTSSPSQILPSSVIFGGTNITYKIPKYLFYGNTSLMSVQASSSLVEIGDYAFSECSSLSVVKFASGSMLERIGNYAFVGTALTSIILPNSLKSVGDYAFYECSQLTNLQISDSASITAIGNYAFAHTSIASVTLPTVLTTVGEGAFYQCSSLTSVLISAHGSLSNIGPYAFYETNISTLSFPASLTSIGSYAFSSCASLRSVTLRSNASIGNNAFMESGPIYEIYNLGGMRLTIGSSEKGYLASNALIIHTTASAEALNDVNVGDLYFKKSGTNWFLFGLATGKNPTTITLNSFSYGGTNVNSFSVLNNAFADNTTITYVTIGNAVTSIGEYAFSNCSSLKEVTFGSSSPLTQISRNTFSGCTSLSAIALPSSIKTIGQGAFENCSSMQSVKLPASLTTISGDAFYGCYSLYDVMNLSTISITKGSEYNGYVGYYALAVRSSGTLLPTSTVETENASAIFAKHNSIWYLVSFIPKISYGTFEIPELTVSGSKSNYKIFNNSLRLLSSSNNVILHKTVTAIETNALSTLKVNNVYFKGTSTDFSKILGSTSYYGTVYYYSNCIHASGLWTYDASGNISTANTELVLTSQTPSTCSSEGVEKRSCPVCHKEETSKLPISYVHNVKNGTCPLCHKEVTTITQDNFNTLSIITNNSSMPFVINAEGVITSTNKMDGSTSTLTIKVTTKSVISFSYMVSSEPTYDMFVISVNGGDATTVSGQDNEYVYYQKVLNAGDTITFTYRKDSSTSAGNDCAFIKDLVITKMS